MKEFHVPYVGSGSLSGRKVTVTVPGSKSITNRAILLAALADGPSRLCGILFSDDSRHLLKCMEDMGFSLTVSEEKKEAEIVGEGGRIPRREASVYVGSAGTAARFLTALTGLVPGKYHLDASEQMKKRPMKPLLDTLRSIGAAFSFDETADCFPFTVRGAGNAKIHSLAVNIDESSQFLSALMIAAGTRREASDFLIEGSHGMSYIRMTARMMEEFGIPAEVGDSRAAVAANNGYKGRCYNIEADASAACYFYAMAAILGSSVTVAKTSRDSLQGDLRFLDVLAAMGCTVKEEEEGLCVTGPEGGRLKGICADLHDCSDQALTLAAIAPFADSPVTIRGIGHIRKQECDRIAAIVTELTRMGIVCRELKDGVEILPGKPKPAKVQTYNDHRVAMSFALTGLRSEGIVIDDPLCCRKTFENYFEVFSEAVRELAGPPAAI